ncbi:hypothetical protein PQG02_08630 [Nostoc sp. UHCC 0926]|uniref:hypothetical protein n=1 Tax=unclassified Nostoc TaxID=2593658 RepID=UPI002360F45D|nr:hypothetical protein [Nostoc sp. UHCC 0926]WDD34377.1 hypothetical protein PQG02_08630 [Nostoc sp. UHCC 0926]
MGIGNESLILADESLILVNESLILVNESLNSVNESLILVNESLNSVNESLNSIPLLSLLPTPLFLQFLVQQFLTIQALMLVLPRKFYYTLLSSQIHI